jgi:hypothetical protein
MRHAAHRDAPPLESFDREVSVSSRARRRRERVLVEHLVEIPHAKNTIASRELALGFEILPHGRVAPVVRKTQEGSHFGERWA